MAHHPQDSILATTRWPFPTQDCWKYTSGMIMLTIKHNLTPKRWTECMNTILEQGRGSPKTNRLRKIQLLKFDLKLMYKTIRSSKLTKHTEEANTISNKAYRTCPGWRAISAVLNKVLSYDLFRKMRKSGGTFDNDAIGSFDRIVPDLWFILAWPSKRSSQLLMLDLKNPPEQS